MPTTSQKLMDQGTADLDNARNISFHAIGRVENNFNEPVAPDLIRAKQSSLILDSCYKDALLGLEVGQEILIIFYLHRSHGYEMQQHPRGDENRPLRGVFALRSPQRPNPIGVTRCRLVSITDNVLRVENLDAINGTPILDIKPA